MAAVPATVVIPMYNARRYVAEAIQSVLTQVARPAELIVVDDGSTDGSASAVATFGDVVRYVRQNNAGIGAARNQGVALGSQPLLAFLDADDRWTPDKLARQTEALERDPALDLVLGHVFQFGSPDVEADVMARIRIPDVAMPGYVAGAMLIRRSAFDRVGLFKVDCRVGEFVDWYLRAMEMGLRLKMLGDVVLWRRIHDANQGIRHAEAGADYHRILKASLDRRRAGATPFPRRRP
jgi:glycosyltransferase involved in cell wall biosynthesis